MKREKTNWAPKRKRAADEGGEAVAFPGLLNAELRAAPAKDRSNGERLARFLFGDRVVNRWQEAAPNREALGRGLIRGAAHAIAAPVTLPLSGLAWVGNKVADEAGLSADDPRRMTGGVAALNSFFDRWIPYSPLSSPNTQFFAEFAGGFIGGEAAPAVYSALGKGVKAAASALPKGSKAGSVYLGPVPPKVVPGQVPSVVPAAEATKAIPPVQPVTGRAAVELPGARKPLPTTLPDGSIVPPEVIKHAADLEAAAVARAREGQAALAAATERASRPALPWPRPGYPGPAGAAGLTPAEANAAVSALETRNAQAALQELIPPARPALPFRGPAYPGPAGAAGLTQADVAAAESQAARAMLREAFPGARPALTASSPVSPAFAEAEALYGPHVAELQAAAAASVREGQAALAGAIDRAARPALPWARPSYPGPAGAAGLTPAEANAAAAAMDAQNAQATLQKMFPGSRLALPAPSSGGSAFAEAEALYGAHAADLQAAAANRVAWENGLSDVFEPMPRMLSAPRTPRVAYPGPAGAAGLTPREAELAANSLTARARQAALAERGPYAVAQRAEAAENARVLKDLDFAVKHKDFVYAPEIAASEAVEADNAVLAQQMAEGREAARAARWTANEREALGARAMREIDEAAVARQTAEAAKAAEAAAARAQSRAAARDFWLKDRPPAQMAKSVWRHLPAWKTSKATFGRLLEANLLAGVLTAGLTPEESYLDAERTKVVTEATKKRDVALTKARDPMAYLRANQDYDRELAEGLASEAVRQRAKGQMIKDWAFPARRLFGYGLEARASKATAAAAPAAAAPAAAASAAAASAALTVPWTQMSAGDMKAALAAMDNETRAREVGAVLEARFPAELKRLGQEMKAGRAAGSLAAPYVGLTFDDLRERPGAMERVFGFRSMDDLDAVTTYLSGR